MEIYSLRYTGSFLQKHSGKNQKDQTLPDETTANKRPERFSEHLDQTEAESAPLTPRELREMAQTGFETGLIDVETYRQLASELPMQTIDQQGRVLDLSDVTDDTPFDFADYYRNQLAIAQSLGDEASYGVLSAAVAFLEGH